MMRTKNICTTQPNYSTKIDPEFLLMIQNYLEGAKQTNYPLHRHPIHMWTNINKDLKVYLEIDRDFAQDEEPSPFNIRYCEHVECGGVRSKPKQQTEVADSTTTSLSTDGKVGMDDKNSINFDLQKKLNEQESLKALDTFISNSIESGALESLYNGKEQDEDDSTPFLKKDTGITMADTLKDSMKRKLEINEDEQEPVPKLTILKPVADETADDGDDEDDLDGKIQNIRKYRVNKYYIAIDGHGHQIYYGN